MSVQTNQYNIERAQQDLARFQRELADESRREADCARRIADIERSLNGNVSAWTLESKHRDMARLTDDIGRIQSKKADISRRIGDRTRDLHRYQQDLSRDEDYERRKLEQAERRRRQEESSYHRSINSELAHQRSLVQAAQQIPPTRVRMSVTYDLFICHASEDKDEFVRRLVEELQRRSVKVWYDEFALTVGDSLRRSIDHGLTNSRYGVVILSSAFFAKNWTQYELDGLVEKEMKGAKVILPIWHKVSKDEVHSYSPSLADKVALNSSLMSVAEIADKLAEVLRGS